MLFLYAGDAVADNYGSADEARIRAVVNRFGPVLDVSKRSADEIRALLATQPPGPACLIGGYDIVPTFKRVNPSLGFVKDADADVAGDAPYGSPPGDPAGEFLPARAISRIPDAGVKNANDFLGVLNRQLGVPTQATPAGTFEQAAAEFAGSAMHVHGILAAPGDPPPRLSPPDVSAMPGLAQLVNGRGRLHVLLHGANTPPGWATLWGHNAAPPNDPFVAALTAGQLMGSGLDGAIVSFSSCYAAMLDIDLAAPAAQLRGPVNQVALACLAAGAKVVFGMTRANWIDITLPFNGFGPALIGHVWKHLKNGVAAAEALRLAKWDYMRATLQTEPWAKPYALKTVLQTQCYGHPMATL